ncbi:nitrite reductase (NADH) large subunit [Thalassolituus maritimus]|uniref:Nitrite reductase (NADH) large subunit n=1 Tax=Thalassolituus maritimus TaxID=484498 RepID=A0A1N7KWX5_9GAMM|nr:FAD-dependent oxidoreductase [Thalassolituus maritimus]SIS66103.1 nitrite reductase (NADH) large subunit [Thalassolituus maritimus]
MKIEDKKVENQLVIIGNGMAANRILEGLADDHPYDRIIVLGDEKISHYNRIMLSPLLAKETTLEDITPHSDAWYSNHRIAIQLGDCATKVDTAKKTVTTETGRSYPYSKLVFATGSRSFIPPIKGADHPDVIGFRTMSDVDTMEEKLTGLKHATVIGAGLLGVEAAVGLKLRGVDVTLIHRNPVLMNRQLDAKASDLLKEALEERGIEVITGVNPEEILANDSGIRAVSFATADTLEKRDTQLVIFATGILPNKDLAASSGINVQRGICVNEKMQTSVNDIFALGECCEFSGHTYGLVAPIWDQASVVVDQLKNIDGSAHYIERSHLTKLKVSGLDIHSIGEYEAPEHADTLTFEDRESGLYKKIILKEDKVIGALCIGDVNDSHWYYELMEQQTNVNDFRDMLIFGEAYCEDVA